MSSGGGFDRWPGGGFVLEGAVGHAAVQDADEPVRECAKGLVVGVAGGGAVAVVEGPRTG